MLPMFTALALLIAYASAVPIHIAAQVTLRGGALTAKAGVAAFVPPRPRTAKRKRRTARIPVKTLFAFLRRLIVRVRIVSICAEGTICAQNAMTTALICGGAEILNASIHAAGIHSVRLRLNPDFSDGGSDVFLQGIISIRTGQIITAAALCAADRIESRFLKWTDR